MNHDCIGTRFLLPNVRVLGCLLWPLRLHFGFWLSNECHCGDMILFNARVLHCISSPVDEMKPVYCMSLYLKTAVIGKNDNSLELTQEQLDSI